MSILARPQVSGERIAQVRALVVRGGGADYHDQGEGHWIDGQIATPMSRYPEYRMRRSSLGRPRPSTWPMLSPLFADEPVPEQGRMRLSALDRAGFGVELAPGLDVERPFARRQPDAGGP